MSEKYQNQQNVIVGVYNNADAAHHVRTALGAKASGKLAVRSDSFMLDVAQLSSSAAFLGARRAIGYATADRRSLADSQVMPAGGYFAAVSVDSDWTEIINRTDGSMDRRDDDLANVVMSHADQLRRVSSGLFIGETIVAFCSVDKDQPLTFGYLPGGGFIIASQIELLERVEAEGAESLLPGEIIEFVQADNNSTAISHDILASSSGSARA